MNMRGRNTDTLSMKIDSIKHFEGFVHMTYAVGVYSVFVSCISIDMQM